MTAVATGPGLTAEFSATAALALVGADRSPLVGPDIYAGWLNDSFELIGMTGTTIDGEVWEEVDGVCTSTEAVDLGVAPDDVAEIAYLTLGDDPDGENIMFVLPMAWEDSAPEPGDPIIAEPGSLQIFATRAGDPIEPLEDESGESGV